MFVQFSRGTDMMGVRSRRASTLRGPTRPTQTRRLLILTALAGALTAWRTTMLPSTSPAMDPP
jgi:hypothetical protein